MMEVPGEEAEPGTSFQQNINNILGIISENICFESLMALPQLLPCSHVSVFCYFRTVLNSDTFSGKHSTFYLPNVGVILSLAHCISSGMEVPLGKNSTTPISCTSLILLSSK